jgi:hypothetical protein
VKWRKKERKAVKRRQRRKREMLKRNEFASRKRRTSASGRMSGPSCPKRIGNTDSMKTLSVHHSCASRTTPRRCSFKAKSLPSSRSEWVVIRVNGFTSTNPRLPARKS